MPPTLATPAVDIASHRAGHAVVRRQRVATADRRTATLTRHRRPLVPAAPGMRYADSPVVWLRKVENDPRIAALRSDRRRNLLAVAGILARSWHEVTCIATPGHDRICADLGCERRTAGRLIQQLIDLQWIMRTGDGCTRVRGEDRVLRAEYVLMEPRPRAAVTPRSQPRARAGWAWSAVPRTKRDRVAAAGTLVGRLRVVSVSGRVSVPGVASVLRRFFAAGWNLADVWHAIEYRPAEGRWTYEAGVRNVAGWLAARLSWWIGAEGRPRRSQSQRVRAEQQEARERAAARAAQEREARRESVAGRQVQAYRAAREQLRARPRRRAEVSQNVAPSLTCSEGVKDTPRGRAGEATTGRAAPGGVGGFARFQETRRALAARRQQRQDEALHSGRGAGRKAAEDEGLTPTHTA